MPKSDTSISKYYSLNNVLKSPRPREAPTFPPIFLPKSPPIALPTALPTSRPIVPVAELATFFTAVFLHKNTDKQLQHISEGQSAGNQKYPFDH